MVVLVVVDQIAGSVIREALPGSRGGDGAQASQRVVTDSAFKHALADQLAERIADIVSTHAVAGASDHLACAIVGVVGGLAIEARFASQPALKVVGEEVRLVVSVDRHDKAQRLVVAVQQGLALCVDALDG